MKEFKAKIGDLVLLRERFRDNGDTCVIVNIYKHFSPGDDGWISFTYEAITTNGNIINLTESCIEKILKDRPSTQRLSS